MAGNVLPPSCRINLALLLLNEDALFTHLIDDGFGEVVIIVVPGLAGLGAAAGRLVERLPRPSACEYLILGPVLSRRVRREPRAATEGHFSVLALPWDGEALELLEGAVGEGARLDGAPVLGGPRDEDGRQRVEGEAGVAQDEQEAEELLTPPEGPDLPVEELVELVARLPSDPRGRRRVVQTQLLSRHPPSTDFRTEECSLDTHCRSTYGGRPVVCGNCSAAADLNQMFRCEKVSHSKVGKQREIDALRKFSN